MSQDILGIRIDQINLNQATDEILSWLNQPQKKYVVTTNIEFIMVAQNDNQFKKILNNADLSIADSSRLSWASDQLSEKKILLRLLKWPFFGAPKILQLKHFDTVTGTDLMEELVKNSSEKGFTVGFLGGQENVAVKLKERLIKKYPKLKVTFASDGGAIDNQGRSTGFVDNTFESSDTFSSSLVSGTLAGEKDHSLQKSSRRSSFESATPRIDIPPTDILFVAFGQVKQEKWIANNLEAQPVKIMIGVGGAFDYLSGTVPRAPKLFRDLGFEWLFRLFIQPWRINRFLSLIKFVFLVLTRSN